MSLALSSLNAQTSLTTRLAQYDIKVDDSVTYRTGQNVIRPYNIGSRYKDLSAIVKGLVDTVRAGGGGGGSTDTTALSNRINERIKYSDTTNRIITVKSLADTMRRDSIETVLRRGINTTIPMRFGSGANTMSTTLDSSGINTRTSATNYSNINVSGLTSISSSTRFDYGYDGIYRYNTSTGFYNRIVIPNPVGSTKTITIQDKTGTVALLSDITDTIANRVLVKSDTGALLVTQADLNTHTASNVRLGGNTVGGNMIVGTIDSQNYITKYFNRGDTIQVSNGLHTYEGKNSEVIARYYNYNQTTGVRNTKGVLIIGSLTTEGNNAPMIGFGTSYTTSTPRITENGIFGYPVLNVYSSSTAGTIIKPAYSASNVGEALTFSLGSYTITNNTPTTGIMSLIKIGTGFSSTGRWAPTSGSSTLNMIIGAVYVNASGTYTGNVNWITDDSVNLAGLGSGGTYFGYRATKNSGWGFYQTGSSAKNAFVGRSLFGTTTDNGSDAVQVVGDLNLTTAGNKIKIATGSNASVNSGTFSGGTATVSNTAVTASSKIWIQYTSCSSCGTTYISAKVAGTSFTVTSSNGSDASTFDYWIIN